MYVNNEMYVFFTISFIRPVEVKSLKYITKIVKKKECIAAPSLLDEYQY